MAKMFKIITNSETSEFSARQFTEAGAYIQRLIGYCGIDKIGQEFGVKTFLKDVEVSVEDFVEATNLGYENWLTKKNETHKRVRVLYGSSVACYVWVWIKK